MPGWPIHFNVSVRTADPRLIRAVERSRALAETLRGIPVSIGVRERLNALNVARAVHGTTALEGTRISEAEALEVFNAAPDRRVLPPDRARDEREARNAQAALEFVQRTVRADPGRPLDRNADQGNPPAHDRRHCLPWKRARRVPKPRGHRRRLPAAGHRRRDSPASGRVPALVQPR